MTTVEDTAKIPSAFRRWMLLVSVVLATTLYSMTVLIVSVVLPQMQGTLSATPDQISWVMTFNILATATVTPLTGWLTARFGWRNVMLNSVLGFVVASILCGQADSLESLVAYRILQGGFGAPLVPLAQAVLLDTFSRRQHGLVTSIYGMGVVVGPIIGPFLGGYLSELYNWRYAFYMLAPVGILAYVGLWIFINDGGRNERTRFDWTGFLALATAIICLQLILDRAERLDWYESKEIIIETAVGAFAFYVFVFYSLIARNPLLNPRHLLDRNYSLGLVIVFLYGMLNFTPMVMLPPMLKEVAGYPESVIGTLLAGRGAGAVIGFFLAMWIGKLDPRIGLSVGFSMLAWAGWYMMGFDMNVTAFDVALASTVQGLAVGILWVPLTVATFATIDPRYLAETMSVFHLLRNIGSSIFISLSVTILIRTSSMNYARFTEFISHFNPLLDYPQNIVKFDIGSISGLAAISVELDRQADMIGFLNAFGAFTLASIIAVPLVLLVRRPPKSE
ncbi:MAG: DHA2 family efflux MFS transporter permease subunit [Alphaproteobacteria bacterium]